MPAVAPACGSCLWLLPVAPAQLLAGAQPHRRSLLQGEKPVEEGEGENPLQALFEATAEALRAVSKEDDAQGFFEDCSYKTTQYHSL